MGAVTHITADRMEGGGGYPQGPASSDPLPSFNECYCLFLVTGNMPEVFIADVLWGDFTRSYYNRSSLYRWGNISRKLF